MELRNTDTVRHWILSYLLWYLTMGSVSRSVRSYVCTDLLSIREGSPSKVVSIEPMEPPLDLPLGCCTYRVL